MIAVWAAPFWADRTADGDPPVHSATMRRTEGEAATGRFLTLEGPDGSGKTSHAIRLAQALRDRGHDAVLTREPGGTQLGERLREILNSPSGPPIEPLAEALLFSSARAEHVAEVIRPALEAGRVVVCARYADSTLAYQGYGSGRPVALLRQLQEIATGGLTPDRTILLDIPADVGLGRKGPDEHTRFEVGFDLDYHRRVRAGFLELAAAEPERWVVVDADRDPDDVFVDVLATALDAIGEPDGVSVRMKG
jgi:dTMP kinase